MSKPAVAALSPLPFELVYEDGIPLEDYRHVIQMKLLIDLIRQVMAERGRTDFFVAGDIFVYYSVDQARDVVEGRSYFRGPDTFFVNGGVEDERERHAWVAWEEGGRLPDLIVELLSPKTAKTDRTVKKDLYARVFRTAEYYLYDFRTRKLEAFRLAGDAYRPFAPNAQGRFWSDQLGLEVGLVRGVQSGQKADWMRLFYPDGRMVPTPEERAAAAEAELKRLRAQLGDPGAKR
jgi:Uma2 family endonuclease